MLFFYSQKLQESLLVDKDVILQRDSQIHNLNKKIEKMRKMEKENDVLKRRLSDINLMEIQVKILEEQNLQLSNQVKNLEPYESQVNLLHSQLKLMEVKSLNTKEEHQNLTEELDLLKNELKIMKEEQKLR